MRKNVTFYYHLGGLCCKAGARAQEYSRFVSTEKEKIYITYHIQKYILSFVKYVSHILCDIYDN